ncbi:MAG: hypothetical protein JNG88_17110, partial [Phycisphaerales bacterium]|nr:hypothetical protein [Phycisphaerales bacterium]
MTNDIFDSPLDALDNPHPLTIDPAMFDRNLAAIMIDQPALADLLRSASLPSAWRPVFALDEWPTWRCESPGEPASWLCDSAVPRTRADALLSIYQPGELNATLPTIACGAELALLLERLPHHKAVFVFERDEAELAAVLRVVDFSAAIIAGRCILLHSDQFDAALADYLDRWPALLPPGNIMLIPGIAEEHVQSLRVIVERFAGERLAARSREFDQIVTARRAPAADAGLRFGIFCGAPQRGAEPVSAAIGHAARQIGVNASEFVIHGPRDVHPLAAARWAEAFQPTIVLCVGHRAELLPPNVKGATYEWLWSKASNLQIDSGRATQTLFSRRSDAAELQQEDFRSRFLPVCADDRLRAFASANAARLSLNAICIVADRPLDDDETLARMQPTHQLLWKHMRQGVRAAWDSGQATSGTSLLAAAEKSTGITIGDDAMRPLFIDAIERVLLTGAICGDAIALANELRLTVMSIGGGWCDVEGVTALGDDIVTAREEICRIVDANVGAWFVFASGADAWPTALPNAMIAGFPVACYAHLGTRDEAIARTWAPGEQCMFRGKRQFAELLRAAVASPSRAFQAAAA